MKRPLFELRPTQFSVGMFEVEKKIKKLRSFKDKELHEYIDSHPVPVVICRNGDAHIIDHHHLVRACLEAGVERVLTEIKADFSKMNDQDFWAEMKLNKWTHLFDQFGLGPHDHTLLPLTVRGLADDPYRSLAWAIREAGGYDKSPEPFCEFKWADFFRKKIKLERTEEGFKKAVATALKLATSPEASQLPGYKG